MNEPVAFLRSKLCVHKGETTETPQKFRGPEHHRPDCPPQTFSVKLLARGQTGVPEGPLTEACPPPPAVLGRDTKRWQAAQGTQREDTGQVDPTN